MGQQGRLVKGIRWESGKLRTIKNLDHNLDCTVDYCTYTCPSYFGVVHAADDLNRTDGIATDGNCPCMDHFVAATADTHTISANSVALTFFDRSSSQHLLDTFAVYASCQIDHLDRYSSLRIATVN